jgi:hypothetical protein
MIIIDLSKERNIETALKKLKNKFTWTKKELLDKKEFEKKSVSRRQEIIRAKHIQRLRDAEKKD